MQQTQQLKSQKKTQLSDSLGDTFEKHIPGGTIWIDDAFYIKKTRFGMYVSILKNPLGAHFITSIDEQLVIDTTRWYLKSLQEGTLDDTTKVVNDGVVGGKL